MAAPAPKPVPLAAATAPALSTADIWSRLIAMTSGRSQKNLLSKLTLYLVTQTTATISSPHESFELAQASEADIESALVSIVGRRLKIEIIDSGSSGPAANAGPSASPGSPADTAATMSQVESNPLIKRATELFGARIVSVQPRKPAVSAPAPTAAPIPISSPTAPDHETETPGDD